MELLPAAFGQAVLSAKRGDATAALLRDRGHVGGVAASDGPAREPARQRDEVCRYRTVEVNIVRGTTLA
eukprot:3686717-Prymnesium_polylepis.1